MITAELVTLGGFFVVDSHDPLETPARPWRPLRELLDDTTLLDARVAFVHSTLLAGSPEGSSFPTRVSASVVHLGVVARLLAPAIAAEAIGLGAIDLDPGAMWCQEDLGGVYPLSVRSGNKINLLAGAVTALTTLFGERYGVPSRALWGNVASAVNSAARMIVAARPELAEPARLAADAILANPLVEDGMLRSGPDFRRHSCCLIYQAAGSRMAICGDCVLAS